VESAVVAEEPAPSAEHDDPKPAPDTTAMELVELTVPDHLPAIAAVPAAGADLPLVISAHGAGGNPELQCQHWQRTVAGRALVLCPRGRRISLRPGEDGMYYYPDHFALEREVMAMVAAARREFGARLSPGAGIYTGFSQGATMGALMIVEHAAEFPYLLLIEGATAEFSPQRARRFAARGGKSIAFVCGGKHCAAGAEQMTQVLRRAGLDARAEYVPHGGHTDDGPVGERASAIFEAMLSELLTGRR
jgi:predicted esterase